MDKKNFQNLWNRFQHSEAFTIKQLSMEIKHTKKVHLDIFKNAFNSG